MAEKKFLLNENQRIWDSYYNGIMEDWTTENKNLENKVFTEEEKVLYSKKTFGNVSPKNITPFNYELYKKKTSVAQYKPVVISFEQHINKPFDEITANDIESFATSTEKKNKLNHLNAFLLSSVTNGYIKSSDLDLLITLLPEAYRKVGRMIAEIN